MTSTLPCIALLLLNYHSLIESYQQELLNPYSIGKQLYVKGPVQETE